MPSTDAIETSLQFDAYAQMSRLIVLSLVLLAAHAQAQTPSVGWSNSYAFPGVSRHQTNMNQADMIEKKETGYYDNLGRNTTYNNVNNFNTNTIGSMTEATVTITGDSNTVSTFSTNSGGQDGSISIQELGLNNSTWSSSKAYGAAD